MEMDVESAKADYRGEKGKAVVFTNIKYTVSQRPAFRGITSKYKTKEKDLVILNGAYGTIKPGRLTIILGPSGAGKTTLLEILAGRKKNKVSGTIQGTNENIVFLSQNATPLENLSAWETLHFAACIKLPTSNSTEKINAIHHISQQLGIKDVLNTRCKSLSGGERKRLSIACELITDPQVLLLDEPTSGLDSVSAISVIQALKSLTRGGRAAACSLHQPSSKIFFTADDVVLLSERTTLYAGPVAEVPDALKKAGFLCPQYYNMADFLLEISNKEHSGNASELVKKSQAYVANIAIKTTEDENEVQPTDKSTLLKKIELQRNTYAATTFQQIRSLIRRCFQSSSRDLHLAQIRVATHLVVAVLLGALYAGAGSSASRVMSNTACLFFFLLFLFFSNAAPTIHTFPSEASVVVREHLNQWYSLPAYCISRLLVDLPFQFLCSIVFLGPAWYLTSQPMEFTRFSLAWLVCFLLTVLAQTFGIVVGTAFDLELGLFVLPAANIPMLMFSEFFIPYREVPHYLRPIASISYFRYAFDAIMHSAYGFDRPPLECNDAFYCIFKDPYKYLHYLGLESNNYLYDVFVLLLWTVLLQITFVCVLVYRVRRSCR